MQNKYTSKDIQFLYAALAVAERSMQKGNLPFGCVLVNPDGFVIAEGENTVIADQDNIAHCEINLIHQLAGKYNYEFLKNCVLYASTEPCPMCAAAIFWSGIGKIIYALSKEGYHAIANTTEPAHIFNFSAKDILKKGGRMVEVMGPLIETEAKEMYKEMINKK